MRLASGAAIAPLLLASILILPGNMARAGVFRWTDAQGVVHFTDSPENIPPEYRAVEVKPPAGPGAPSAALADSDNAPSKSTPGEPAAAQPENQAAVQQEPSEETKAKEEPGDAGAAPSGYAATTQGATLDKFGRDETWWRDRKTFWEQRLADSQRLYNEARREFNRVNQRYDSREYKQMKLLRERMETLEGEIAKAQAMLDGGLSREARKAGAPPGWVR